MNALLDIARPNDVQGVQDVLIAANERRQTVEARGGGSKDAIGSATAAELILQTGGFDAVVDYDPAELVLTAGAGCSLAKIEALLDASGQMLAFEPMDYGPLLGGERGRATLGGVLAGNVSGPRRLSAGAARDHFIGLEAVSGRGDVFKAGGRVVKNVTGYDLPKLLGGSWGTLAVLTTVSLKVLPKPRMAATVAVHGLSDQAAAELMSACVGSAAPVTSAAHLPAGMARGIGALIGVEDAITLLRLEGVEPSARAGGEIVRRLADGGDLIDGLDTTSLWKDLRDVAPFVGRESVVWRISAPPADGWRIVAALASLGGEAIYDWAGGLIWLSLPGSDEASEPEVRRAVAAVGGHATLIRAGEAVRSRVAVFPPEAPGLAALSARVRTAFDPAGVLGPRHRLAGT